jgi:hypothetical protein
MRHWIQQTVRATACVAPGAALLGVLAAGAWDASAAPVGKRINPRSYRVSAGLREVSNLRTVEKAFPLSTAQRALLARNKFAVRATSAPQFFNIYDENDYRNVPSFVTVDSVLHLYHIFFSFSLRKVESQRLLPVVTRLTRGMLSASIADWKAASDLKVKSAALKNVAFFGVADRLMGGAAPVPEAARALIAREVALANAQEGFLRGAIFPYEIDYSQFAPRGHYTRSEPLKKYFRAMMWYGQAPFATRVNGKSVDEPVVQALLWTRALYSRNLARDWARVYEPTSFYVGASDDLTPREWKTASDAVYGRATSVNAFAPTSKLRQFVSRIDRARPPRIAPRFAVQMGLAKPGQPGYLSGPHPSGAQARFMGQRYVPDSDIMQRLVWPVQRVFPTGLDVMSVLGSRRATQLLDQHSGVYNTRRWAGYKPERAKLTREFAALPQASWNSNLYLGWLYGLKALLDPAPAASPSFMKSTAWADKSLSTALGSWAQLRHDTLLYAKQGVVEMGGADEEPPFVRGYVEPNLRFYDRLLSLTRASKNGLLKRQLLPQDLYNDFNDFESMLLFLRRVSQKQLAGRALTKDDYENIRYIGGRMEQMTLRVMTDGGTSWTDVPQTDRHVATVADVHTGGTEVLEVGVGSPQEMWVVVPVEGKLSLARGAVFSFYEWKQPASNRLTDEEWQKMLRAGRAPAQPIWTRSFRTNDRARAVSDE